MQVSPTFVTVDVISLWILENRFASTTMAFLPEDGVARLDCLGPFTTGRAETKLEEDAPAVARVLLIEERMLISLKELTRRCESFPPALVCGSCGQKEKLGSSKDSSPYDEHGALSIDWANWAWAHQESSF